jgi:two-component system sensor histidine kinase DegS
MISVNVSYQDDFLKVVIQDDGKGFDVSKQNEIREDYSGFGLSMMKERINLLSGYFTIHSEIGKGTNIVIEIPKGVIVNGSSSCYDS